MDTLQNAPTSNKLINYRPIAEIAVGLMLGIAVCGIMPAGGAAVLCIMTACGAAGVVFALLRHTRSALFAASVLVGILFAALRRIPWRDHGRDALDSGSESAFAGQYPGRRDSQRCGGAGR